MERFGWLLLFPIAGGLLAFCVLGIAFFQSRIEALALRAQQMGGRSIWLGLLGYGVLIILLILAGRSPLKFIPGVLILLLLLISLLAFIVEAQEVGQRIALLREKSTPLSTILLGALVCELAFFLPILGQIFWVLLLARGLGACLGSLRR